MTKEEFFNLYYPGLKWVNISESCKMIQHAIWGAYNEQEELVDVHKLKSAYQICVQLYNDFKKYEDQIKNDVDEINGKHGTPFFGLTTCDEISPTILDMSFICETYHKHFEFLDTSIFCEIKNKNEIVAEGKISERTEFGDKKQIYETVYFKDQAPEHKKWFVKVLDSKIPQGQPKDQLLHENLITLFKELCKLGYVDSDNHNEDIFVYRFSGFNGSYPIEHKILWKGKNTFLGYIVRCLISDKNDVPMNFGDVASFFVQETGKPINLASAKNCVVVNFEEEKRKQILPTDFIHVVELLKKCGFVNVEFTSSRR